MNRREFLGATAGCVAASVIPPSGVPAAQSLRSVFVLRDNEWVPCRMEDLRRGDWFSLREMSGDLVPDGPFVAASDAARDRNGVWGVEASIQGRMT